MATARRIYIQPYELWSVFKSNALDLEQHSKICAEYDEQSVWFFNDDGIPCFVVFNAGEEIETFDMFDEDDIDQYIMVLVAIGFDESEIKQDESECGSDNSEPGSESVAVSDHEEQETIEAREDELDTIITNMVYDILGDDESGVSEADIDDAAHLIKEVVCDILGKKYGMPVYRPMYLVDENGSKFFEEYPYPVIVDSDN